MRDALGGTVVLMIIVIFIVFALGYLAFNVNYTKAFRMKNKIISVYEDYRGDCSSSECQAAITDYAKSIGYTVDSSMTCPKNFEKIKGLYCVKEQIVDSDKSNSSISYIKKSGKSGVALSDIKTKHYYTIVTKINLQIPVINNIIDFSFFYVSGDTRSFEVAD